MVLNMCDANIFNWKRNNLLTAIETNAYDKVVSILEGGVDLNVTNRGNNPLVKAITDGRESIVELLLENEADPDLILDDSVSPVHVAAQCGNLKIVKLLVEHGRRADDTVPLEMDPIHFAAIGGHTEIIDYFLENVNDIDVFTRGETRFRWAVAYKEHVVQHLLERGIKINEINHRGRTVLHYCACNGMAQRLEYLIQNGAHIQIKDKRNQTPLNEVLKVLDTESLFDTDFNDDKMSAKVLMKYMLLQNEHLQFDFSLYGISDNFHYLKEFWNDCVTEVEIMQKFTIGKTSITLYKFLRDIFDDKQLFIYLYNECLMKELENIENSIKQLRIYSSVAVMVKDKIKRGMEKKIALDAAVSAMDNLVPNLPLESKWKIFGYLSVGDLNNFVKTFEVY